MIEAVKLLPCPFCGSTNIDHEGWVSTERKGPACDDCAGCADTVELWNSRPFSQAGAGGVVETWDTNHEGYRAVFNAALPGICANPNFFSSLFQQSPQAAVEFANECVLASSASTSAARLIAGGSTGGATRPQPILLPSTAPHSTRPPAIKTRIAKMTPKINPITSLMIKAMIAAIPAEAPEDEIRVAYLEVIRELTAVCVFASIPTELLKHYFHRGKNEGLKIRRAHGKIGDR